MNKINLFSILFFLLLLHSCGKDSSPNDSSGILKAKIDGVEMNCKNIVAIGNKSQPFVLTIVGSTDSFRDGISIQVNFKDNSNQLNISTIGDCRLQDVCHLLQVTYNEGLSNEKSYISGQDDGTAMNLNFSILSYAENGQLKGTFSGKLFDEVSQTFINLTDGEFELNMTLE